VLAIAGTPLLSGFFSKDMILHHAAAFASLATDAGRSRWYWAFFVLPTVIAFVTAFYMTRCWMLTFWGKPRNQHLYDHAHEQPVMYLPLGVLALFSVFAGYGIVPQLLKNAINESNLYCRKIDPAFVGFNQAWPAEIEKGEGGEERPVVAAHKPDPAVEAMERGHAYVAPFKSIVFYAFLVGIGLGFLIYSSGYAVARKLHAVTPLRWVHTWLYRRMYFDELYYAVFVSIVMFCSRLAGFFDRYVVDGIVNGAGRMVRGASVLVGLNDKYVVDGAVNGAAELAQGLGAAVRAPQTGRVRMYVTVLMIAVTLGLAGAIIAVLSH
jgi:NADH-quinone oxidoreductase subunit L